MGILRLTKCFILLSALCGVCSLLSCIGAMPDTFSRIDANKLRVIGVVIGPRPEVSPGDTVTASAYFGGNEVTSINDIKVVYRYVWGINEIAYTDVDPITPLKTPVGLPDSARISFIIKPDVFRERQPYDSIPQSTIDSISELFMHPKDSVAAMLSSLSDSQKTAFGDIIEKMVLPAMLMFTAHSANGTALSAAAQFTIKYHVNLPAITPPNNNPDISWVGVCKVPDRFAFGFNYFDPSSAGNYSMTYLYNKNNPALCDSIVDVDTGYAYFLACDNGISITDTTMDAITDKNGNRIFETYTYKWFYQNVNNLPDQDDSLMQIDDNGSACIEMKPPGNTAMKNFRAWVACYDQINGQRMRPRGMCVRAVKGAFRFSPQYIKMKSGEN